MLDALSEVQAFDLQRDTLAHERTLVPQALIDARAQKERLLGDLGAVAAQHETLRKRVAANELDLKAIQERRKDASDAALRSATSKEMAQFQNQELQFANRAQELEEDTLPLMEQLEQLANAIAELQAQLDTLNPSLQALETEEGERQQLLALQDADLEERRTRASLALDAALLRQYEQVRRARKGLALVGLKDGKRCGGCHVQLPIHVVQKVRKGDGVTRCPACGRLLMDRPA